MSRTIASTLNHQWDPYEKLEVQRNRQCVGMAPSQRRECHNIVNRNDLNAFHRLMNGLSSQRLDIAILLPQLQVLASLGLCKRHRHTQVDDVVEGWTRNISNAIITAELRAAMQHSRSYTRSNTASFASTESVHDPAADIATSSTSRFSAGSSSAAEADIESTLRCLEANREQERVLMLRLANLQSPRTPRMEPIRTASHASTTSVPSLDLSNGTSTNSSPPLRRHASTSSSPSGATRSTTLQSNPISSASGSSPSQRHRRQPVAFTIPPSEALGHGSHIMPPQQRSTDSTSPSTVSTSTAQSPSPPSRPSCTTVHVRRLPVSDDCPICYDSMQGQIALDWCKGGCGQSVHKECMDVWRAICVANGTEISCTMCRTKWTEGCRC